MKILLSLFLFLTILSNFNPKIKQDDYSKKIIGKWKYIETKTKFGEKVESIESNYGTLIESGPKIIYNSDHTYKMIFTSENIDKGKWKFNQKTMTIEHQLLIDSSNTIGKSLIKDGEAIKQSDGNYYEKNDCVISKIDDKEMVVNEYDLRKIYRREK